MPQMAPINWLFLFLLFSLSLLIFNFMNYFSFLPPHLPTSKHSISQNSLSWKW